MPFFGRKIYLELQRSPFIEYDVNVVQVTITYALKILAINLRTEALGAFFFFIKAKRC